ncbi:MAG: bi-domain-containing oxidoreductase [Gemmatimonadota bacterium]
MKQLLERLDSGELQLVDVPCPTPSEHHLVVRTRATVISAGTERMLVEFGRANLLEKARQQPDRVKKILAKARADGLSATWDAVRSRLRQPLPLGYCQAGRVSQVGRGCEGFKVGDRVVTNGPHAEWVQVPHTLAAAIPQDVSYRQAAFAPLGAIALQGVRNASPTLGETIVVFGLGLVGLLTVQVLRAHGCRVLGLDLAADRRKLARELGAIVACEEADVVAWVRAETDGRGADAVLLTLDSDSDEPVRQAAQMSRHRGRIVLVGVTGLQLNRADFYERELSFAVSRSYGPGRYDPDYEERGRDYPLPYVRWTAKRNFEAFLGLVARGDVEIGPLVSHTLPFERAPEAYDLLLEDRASLGIVLTYGESGDAAGSGTLRLPFRAGRSPPAPACVAGVIGSGVFPTRVLLPLFSGLALQLRSVCAPSGTSAGIVGRRFGFQIATSDPDAVLADEAVTTVFVFTRHDSHAELTIRALEAGKHVFVEKPLALTPDEVERVASTVKHAPGLLTVGFNRRFAPHTRALLARVEGRTGPLALQITVNAGPLPANHWLLDPEIGGGRLVGEGCHFVDLARALVGRAIADWHLEGKGAGIGGAGNDPWHLGLEFEDGSVATVHYVPTGSSSCPKERLEASFDGKTFVIDNWRRLKSYRAGPRWSLPSRQDKGHRAELEAWVNAVTVTGEPPIPYAELLEVSGLMLDAAGFVAGS